jgi:hypothetical protein
MVTVDKLCDIDNGERKLPAKESDGLGATKGLKLLGCCKRVCP